MHKPAAALPTNTMQRHYDQIANDAKKFGADLLRILLTLSSIKLTESQFKGLKELRAKIFILLLEVKGIEELTRHTVLTPGVVPALLSEALAQDYLFQVLLHYGFIFHANNCFTHLLGDGEIEDCWLDVVKVLTDSYNQLFLRIHSTSKSELYIGSLIVTILKEMISQKLFNQKDGLARFTISYLFFRDFIGRTKSVPFKLQCEIYMFILEHQEDIYDKFIAFNFESRSKDFHEKTILNLIAEFPTPTTDDDWYRYFASATKLFRYLLSLDEKIKYFKENSSKISKINCAIDVKNYSAVYKEVSRLLNSFNWLEVFEKLEKALKDFNTLRFEYSKILQTKNLLLNFLDVLETALVHSVRIIDFALANSKGLNWQIYYNLLQLKKIVFDNRLKIRELHQTISGEPKTIDEAILNIINGVVCTLRAMDLEAALSKQKFDEIQSTKKDKQKSKKFTRNRRKRDNSENQENSRSTRLIEVTTKAESFISNEQYDQACSSYLEFLQIKDLTTWERIQALSCLADIYQGTEDKTKALENYTEALRLSEEALGTEQEAEQKKFFQTQVTSLRDIRKEFEKNSSDKESSSDEEFVSEEGANSKRFPEPTILKEEIPIPEFVRDITRLLSEANIKLIVVGGYVRDHFQGQKAKDIDVVIFDQSLKLTDNGLLYKIVDPIKNRYPATEVRGRRHPVLHIQHEQMIVEISCLKIFDTPSNQSFAKEYTPKLLYRDAVVRDTTDCALFYDPDKKIVIDFFNGVRDIRENRLTTISPPNVTFSKEPELIFRVLRSIVKRSADHPNLIYSSDIIAAMRKYIERLSSANKDRCFREVTQMFFSGHGCATWQFLSRYDLAKHFLILPKGDDLNFKHAAMVQRALSSLDSRIKHDKSFHHAFTFAVLLWGTFCEQLEPELTESNVRQTAKKVCEDSQLIFRLPEDLTEEIKQIWFTYLHNTKKLIFNKPQFKHYHYVLAKLLENFIKRAMHIDHKPTTELRNGFFHRSRLECIIKDIICSHKIVYSYSNKVTTLKLENTKTLNAEQTFALKRLKHLLINMLGDEQVDIEYDQNALYLSTHYIDKKRAIDRLMEFAFGQGKEEFMESKLRLA